MCWWAHWEATAQRGFSCSLSLGSNLEHKISSCIFFRRHHQSRYRMLIIISTVTQLLTLTIAIIILRIAKYLSVAMTLRNESKQKSAVVWPVWWRKTNLVVVIAGRFQLQLATVVVRYMAKHKNTKWQVTTAKLTLYFLCLRLLFLWWDTAGENTHWSFSLQRILILINQQRAADLIEMNRVGLHKCTIATHRISCLCFRHPA